MNNNIKKTKKKLAIIFSIIFFVVIFILWFTYFSAKYFKESSAEKIRIITLINLVESWDISIDDVMNFEIKFEKSIWNSWKKDKQDIFEQLPPWDQLPPDLDNNSKFKPDWFINYVLLDNTWSVISSNIKDDIDEDFIVKIASNNNFFKLTQDSWFYVKKFNVNQDEGTFIILKKLRYSFSDYINDLLGFLFINILFSLCLYFVGLKFVNKAFVPVEENIKDMKDFIHNAWHELKTPISVIDSNIQLMDDMKIYDEDMTKELKKEVLRLNSIIEWLIKLSDIDLFRDIINNNLKNVVEDVLNQFKFKIQEKDLKINVKISKDINIKSNKDYFYIFISNLIWNAIKYNKDHWTINIKFKDWEFDITDSWVWIDKKDIWKIFDRFFKSDKSRNSEWFWIGLSLVKKISDIYKWNIEVKSKKEEGTTFIIRF